MLSRYPTRACGGLLLLASMAYLVGCGGPNYKARAIVKGKVSIGGKPLTAGSVSFYNKQNVSGTATIDTKGNYNMPDAPIGECTITVSVPKMPMGGPSGMMSPFGGPGGGAAAVKGMKSVDPSGSGKSISIMGEMPAQIVPIPEKYSKPDTSGLTYKVEKGEHTFDIDLKP